ncbi:MAG: hypothetical protein AAB863_01005 [Patescibacteria group bacterium]
MAKKKKVRSAFTKEALLEIIKKEYKTGRTRMVLRNPKTGVQKYFDLSLPDREPWVVLPGGKKRK